MKKLYTLALLGAFAALVSACGGCEEGKTAANKSATPAPTAAAPAPSPSPEVPGSPAAASPDKPKWHPKSEEVYAAAKAAQPTAQITQGSLPAGFPTDLPMYPDAKPKTSM